MLDKVKVTITREDGSPLCHMLEEESPIFLSDGLPFLLIRKNGGAVEAYGGDIHRMAEVIADLTKSS